MKRISAIIAFGILSIISLRAQEKDHPVISLGGTDLMQSENIFDDFVPAKSYAAIGFTINY